MSILKENSPFNNYSLLNSIKFIAITQIIKKYKISKIELKFFDDELKNHLLKYFEDLNLKFNFLETIKKNNTDNSFHLLPKIIRNFLNFIVKIVNFYSFREKKKFFNSKEVLIVSHFSHFNEANLNKNIFSPYQWVDITKYLNRKIIYKFSIQQKVKIQNCI